MVQMWLINDNGRINKSINVAYVSIKNMVHDQNIFFAQTNANHKNHFTSYTYNLHGSQILNLFTLLIFVTNPKESFIIFDSIILLVAYSQIDIHQDKQVLLFSNPIVMTTHIGESESPSKRESFISNNLPADSIVRQIVNPNAGSSLNQLKYTIHQNGQNQMNPGVRQSIPINIPNVIINSHQLPNATQASQVSQWNQSQLINQKVFNQRATVISPQSNIAVPPPVRRVQYVPYEQRYIEYVQQRVSVPVQRVCTDYYQVEHIIEYVPIEKEQIVYQTQPQQVVTMKLQYVPVEQKIVHITDKNLLKSPGSTNFITSVQQNEQINSSSLYQQVVVPPEVKIEKSIKRSRTNFVTSEGYDSYKSQREIQRVLTQFSVSQKPN